MAQMQTKKAHKAQSHFLPSISLLARALHLPSEVKVRSMTTPDSHSVTASDTWFFRYLVAD